MTEPQNVRLYSEGQVTLATFLGLPIAGGILIGKNARAMGNPKAARQSIAVGAVGTVIVLATALLLPPLTLILPVAYVIGVQQWYKQTQEAAFKDHLAQGGERGSWAVPIGVGLVVLILISAIIFYGVAMIGLLAWSRGDG